MNSLPERVQVLIEVPKGGFVKRELHEGGSVDFISPLPSPYNYGCVPELPGADGDPQDVVVLGPRLRAGTRYDLPVVGVVRFFDAGAVDDKLIASDHAPTAAELRGLRRFFKLYALAKLVLNRRRGLSGRTALVSVVERSALQERWRNPR
ncbi:MAG: inorganic diphosphatase [Myxococcota bacterium]|nr:inorganic diphosphatase [Myxococcota bacterium]